MANQKKTTKKITKIGNHEVKATLKTLEIYQDKFSVDFYEDANWMLQYGLEGLKLARMFYAMAATVTPDLLKDEEYDKFMDSYTIKDFMELNEDIMLLSFWDFPEKTDEGKPQAEAKV